ncbi:MAG: capsule biosynthesis protein [Alphaproteobacteria bacterium]|nr:capsule biosynthesis protein [Alphaproteobacteria bacterium]
MTHFPDLRRAQSVASPATVATPRPIGLSGIRRLFGAVNIWFWAIVGIPTLLAGVYYFGIASDLYLSEARFVVRGPAKQASGISGFLQSAGLSSGEEDAYTVHEFITSRDPVRKLERANDLRAVLNRPEADIVTRFPGIRRRTDFEALYSAYSRFVSVEKETSTGVSLLRVKAFRPEDAQMIARSLLTYSEQLVNDLNERARADALKTFQKAVGDSQQQIAKIQTELTAYRIKQQLLDPKSASMGPLELLAQLNTQLANAKGALSEMLTNAPNSPQIPVVKTRIASLEKLISDQRANITGDNGSVASNITEYERLNLALQLSEKQLASAIASLETAKLEAQRQQLYLETIAEPNLADYPLYPKRIESFAIVVVSCLVAYGIAWLLVASVREHAAA